MVAVHVGWQSAASATVSVVRKRSEAFPVGLYGMLLFALCWLTLPAAFAPVERILLGATCLLPRGVVLCFGAPVQAAARAPVEPPAALLARVAEHDLRAPDSLLATGLVPLHCS